MLCAVKDDFLHIGIDVRVAGEQIQGQVSDGTGLPHPFSGWLGLIGALDGMLGPRGGATNEGRVDDGNA